MKRITAILALALAATFALAAGPTTSVANCAANWTITGIETGPWTVQSGPSINATPATSFYAALAPSGALIVSNAGPKYAGSLAKQSNPLPNAARLITFSYDLKYDDSAAFGQVVETDTKITDANGWTYDGSFQWNLAAGWMSQISNPWVNTGVKIPLTQDEWNTVTVVYALDYVAHTLTVVSVNGQPVSLAPLPAKQENWAKGQIITQLQLCTNGQAGAYAVRFRNISYQGSV